MTYLLSRRDSFNHSLFVNMSKPLNVHSSPTASANHSRCGTRFLGAAVLRLHEIAALLSEAIVLACPSFYLAQHSLTVHFHACDSALRELDSFKTFADKFLDSLFALPRLQLIAYNGTYVPVGVRGAWFVRLFKRISQK